MDFMIRIRLQRRIRLQASNRKELSKGTFYDDGKKFIVICGGVVFFYIFPPYGPVLRKTKKIAKIQDLKIRKSNFVRILETKIQICGRL